MSDNSLLAFTEKQEILDNLSITLKRLYEDDDVFSDSKALKILTERTYGVMKYMETVQEELSTDISIIKVAEKFKIPTEQLINDVSEIILLSTVARQAITLESITE